MSWIRYNKVVLTGFMLLLMSAFAGCSSDTPVASGNGGENYEGLTITGSVVIPEMGHAGTRGAFGDKPFNELKLTVVEFDLGEDAEHSFLTNIYDATVTSATSVESGVSVSFKFTLKAAGTPKVLHLMVADDYLTTGFGSVASVLPGITTGTGKDDYWGYTTKEGYWGYVEFEDGFTNIDDYGNPVLKDGVAAKLTDVPLIRNFAKLSVEAQGLENFHLLGFDIVNIPTAGTVAPWDQGKLAVPSLLQVDDDGNIVRPYAMKLYSQIEYGGIIPGVAQFVNTEVEARTWNAGSENMTNTASRYLYEHPYESTRRTYIIVHGEYCTDRNKSDNPDDWTWTKGFYKLDIGTRNVDGSFNYYNIIRNIHYKVRIEYVSAVGSPTVSDAINRAPFNNLTASTETASMLNVSDGENILFVNATSHIITSQEPVRILYRYQNLSGNPENAGTPQTVNLKPGSVIASFTEAEEYTDENKVKWFMIKITPNQPDEITQRQSFSIVDGKGLGRTINLVLREPWEYAKIGNTENTATIAPGINSLYSNPEPQPVSSVVGQPLTVYFNLPNGLPESIFPLEFQLQARNQALENNKIDNMVVSTGASLFNPEATAISYIKTVTYPEYQYRYISDYSNDVDVNSPNTNHTVRCRFLTINNGTEEGEIRIYNPYFTPNASVKVIRSASVPLVTP